MSENHKREPAFPRSYTADGHNGMTLRDYFAAQALAANEGRNPNLPDSAASLSAFPHADELAKRQAKWAYLVADAMLKEREN